MLWDIPVLFLISFTCRELYSLGGITDTTLRGRTFFWLLLSSTASERPVMILSKIPDMKIPPVQDPIRLSRNSLAALVSGRWAL